MGIGNNPNQEDSMTKHEIQQSIIVMELKGDQSIRALAKAWRFGDSDQRENLQTLFSHIFIEYGKMPLEGVI